MSNDLIFSLETATRSGSLALMRGGLLIASSTGIEDESNSVNLLSRIQSLLDDTHIALRDIKLFATASGPGSFTGLRIGLATIKAFAATFDRSCIGVPTLEAIAYASGAPGYTYALLPAGRGEVFAQMFRGTAGATGTAGVSPAGRAQYEAGFDNESTCESTTRALRALEASETPAIPVTPAEHNPPDILLKRICERSSIHWAGSGAHLYKALIRERASELGIEFVEEVRNEGDRLASASHADESSTLADARVSAVSGDESSTLADARVSAVSGDESSTLADVRVSAVSGAGVKSASHDVRWTLAQNEEQLAKYVAILAEQRVNNTQPNRAEDLRAIYVRPSDAELNK